MRAAIALALAALLVACGGGDDEPNRTQICLDPTTLQPQSMCFGAGCCAFTTLQADAAR